MPQTRYTQSREVLQRTVSEDVLLAVPDRSDMERLSGTSAVVWKLLESPKTLDEIVETLADAYGASPATIRADVEALLDSMRYKNLLTTETG